MVLVLISCEQFCQVRRWIENESKTCVKSVLCLISIGLAHLGDFFSFSVVHFLSSDCDNWQHSLALGTGYEYLVEQRS